MPSFPVSCLFRRCGKGLGAASKPKLLSKAGGCGELGKMPYIPPSVVVKRQQFPPLTRLGRQMGCEVSEARGPSSRCSQQQNNAKHVRGGGRCPGEGQL